MRPRGAQREVVPALKQHPQRRPVLTLTGDAATKRPASGCHLARQRTDAPRVPLAGPDVLV